MPRPRKTTSDYAPGNTQLSSGQATYVIERLLAERRVSAAEIARYVAEMHREISDLEERLNRLREASGVAAATAIIGAAAGAAATFVARRRGPGRPAAAASTESSGATPVRRGPGRPAGSGAGRRSRRQSTSGAGAGAGAGTTSGSASTGATSASGGGAQTSRARRGTTPITAEQLASRQLQGRYLALVRRFPENRRTQFAKMAKEKGREYAINEMQSSLKK